MIGALASAGCAVVPQGNRPTPVPKPKPPRASPHASRADTDTQPTPSPSPTATPTPAGPAPAIAAGVVPGPALATLLPQDSNRTDAGVAGLQASCTVLQRRTDGSGLTTGADWQRRLRAASGLERGRRARNFFLR